MCHSWLLVAPLGRLEPHHATLPSASLYTMQSGLKALMHCCGSDFLLSRLCISLLVLHFISHVLNPHSTMVLARSSWHLDFSRVKWGNRPPAGNKPPYCIFLQNHELVKYLIPAYS